MCPHAVDQSAVAGHQGCVQASTAGIRGAAELNGVCREQLVAVGPPSPSTGRGWWAGQAEGWGLLLGPGLGGGDLRESRSVPSCLPGKETLTWLPRAWGCQGLGTGPSLGCPGPSVRKWGWSVLCKWRDVRSKLLPLALLHFPWLPGSDSSSFQTASPYQRRIPRLVSTHGA